MPKRPLLAALALLVAAGCHKAPQPVGGLNPDDAAALNNAADMLDTSADDLTAPSNATMNADDGASTDKGAVDGAR